MRVLLDQLARDDELQDLAGALVDAQEARIAEQLLDGVFLDVAVAAVDLQHAVGDAAERLGGEVLAAGRLLGDAPSVDIIARDALDHCARRQRLGLAVGEHALDQLELRDRPAELLALGRVGAPSSIRRSHMPTATAAMWMRAWSSDFIA